MSLACGIPPRVCLLPCFVRGGLGSDAYIMLAMIVKTGALPQLKNLNLFPRLCRYIMGNYEDDLDDPQWEPPRGYGMNSHWVVFAAPLMRDTRGE
ncbi:hypothetical protein HPP92_001294 [Vanilla planifolia]|uniref:Uncharacterized protein n=1 Tax=Vanilla planifolia TaxID=51239 RepID=A0A835SBN9_VANPL|nr:hypothetical protein HPP92_001294 [Vanilla planifolia]